MEAENNSNTIASDKNESLVNTSPDAKPAVSHAPVDFKKALDLGATRRKLRSESIKKALVDYRRKKAALKMELFNVIVDNFDQENFLALRAVFDVEMKDFPKMGLQVRLEEKFGVPVKIISAKEEKTTTIVFDPPKS